MALAASRMQTYGVLYSSWIFFKKRNETRATPVEVQKNRRDFFENRKRKRARETESERENGNVTVDAQRIRVGVSVLNRRS